jgi:membrane protein required for colicin V production
MPVDILLIAVFALGFWHGYSNGIINTVFNVMAYLFGITLAFKITPTTTNILERLFHTENPSMYLAAFVVNLVIIVFMLRQAANALEGILEKVYLGAVNRILGGGIMAMLSVMIYSVILWFGVRVQFVNDATLAESRFYIPILKEMPSHAKNIVLRLKPIAGDVWDTSLKWMDRLENYGMDKTSGRGRLYELPDPAPGEEIIESEPEAQSSKPKSRPQPMPENDNGIEY